MQTSGFKFIATYAASKKRREEEVLPVKENVENMQIKELICFPESNVLLGVRAVGFCFVLVHLTGHP